MCIRDSYVDDQGLGVIVRIRGVLAWRRSLPAGVLGRAAGLLLGHSLDLHAPRCSKSEVADARDDDAERDEHDGRRAPSRNAEPPREPAGLLPGTDPRPLRHIPHLLAPHLGAVGPQAGVEAANSMRRCV